MSEEEFFYIAKKLDFERFKFYITYNLNHNIVNYIKIEDLEKLFIIIKKTLTFQFMI